MELNEVIISQLKGIDLWRAIGYLRKGTADVGENRHKYLKLCYSRAKELNRDKFGSWEEAKTNLDHMEVPTGLYKTETMLPILGYPCQFVVNDNKTSLVIFNGKLNLAYIRELGESVSFATAKKIFSS